MKELKTNIYDETVVLWGRYVIYRPYNPCFEVDIPIKKNHDIKEEKPQYRLLKKIN